jgi:mannose-1-phosphate guanylyltransferase
MVSTAMVLAAGRGERMRPLSDVVPKPALPLTDRPVIASPLALAASAGARRAVVNTWHLAGVMETELGTIDPGIEIAVSREPELMGTAGGIALARDRGLLGDRGPVLVINGDGVLNLDLAPLQDRMTGSNDLVTLALLPHLDPGRWSRVALDGTGAVCRISEPGVPGLGEVPLLYPGAMLVSREALNELDTGVGDIPTRLWHPALVGGRLGGVVVSGHWREVGTPEDYLEAVMTRLNGGTVIHPSASVDPSSSTQSAVIGRDARIGPGSVVRESVVARGATVGPSCRVRGSVLLGAVETDAGEDITGVFRAVCPNQT